MPGNWQPGLGSLECIDGLWSLLIAVCRDPGWRERLRSNTGEFIPLNRGEIAGAQPSVWEQLANAGPLAMYVRPADYHGDTTPHLAIRSLAWKREIVLEEISDWHRGWRTGDSE